MDTGWTAEDEQAWQEHNEAEARAEREAEYEPDYESIMERRMEARYPDPGTDVW